MDQIVIWGEVLFCIDFSMDFCALYFTCRLLGRKVRLRKLLITSALCAAAGVYCTAIQSSIISVIVFVVGIFLAAWIVIPKNDRQGRNIIRAFFLFLFLEACTGGMMTAAFFLLNRLFSVRGFHLQGEDTRQRLFFLAASLIFFILAAVSRILSKAEIDKLSHQNGRADVQWNGHETSVTCFFDSGNLIKEPISGKPVIVMPYKEQYSLGLDPNHLENGTVHGSRLIPIKTLDRTSLLWGILPDQIIIRADSFEIRDADLYIVFSNGTNLAIVPTSVLI